MSSRRLNYLIEIHKRENHELLKRVYRSQKKNPVKGDWVEQVKKDLETVGMDEEELDKMNKATAKKEIKCKIRDAAFEYLTHKQETHDKVKDIVYEKLETKKYITSAIITTKEAEMITAIRSQTIRGIRNNFHTFYKNDLQCRLCMTNLDTQEHCMSCPKILEKIPNLKSHIKYMHAFGIVEEQKELAQLFIHLLGVREEMLQDLDDQEQENDYDDEDINDICLPVADNTGPCTSTYGI